MAATNGGLNNKFAYLVNGVRPAFDRGIGLKDQGLTEAQVGAFFNSENTKLKCDYYGAAYLSLAKGLIDTLKSGEFDSIFVNTRRMGQYLTHPREVATADDLEIGDFSAFGNHKDYCAKHPNGGWVNENVIALRDMFNPGGKMQFFGLPGGTKTEAEWLDGLVGGFNEGGGRQITVQQMVDPNDGAGGFKRRARFFNVPKVGLSVFLHRNKK